MKEIKTNVMAKVKRGKIRVKGFPFDIFIGNIPDRRLKELKERTMKLYGPYY